MLLTTKQLRLKSLTKPPLIGAPASGNTYSQPRYDTYTATGACSNIISACEQLPIADTCSLACVQA